MSSGSTSSEEEFNPRYSRDSRVARKSTTPQVPFATSSMTRRQAAVALQNQNKQLLSNSDKFMENFNPETSAREKRKLNRKIHPPSNVRRPAGSLYDENGIHIQSCCDLCDCLNINCEGCFFECPKCGSQKCGTDCRVHRKFTVEQIEYHGYDYIVKNPFVRP